MSKNTATGQVDREAQAASYRKQILRADLKEADWGSKASALRKQLCEATRKFKDGELCIHSTTGDVVSILSAHVRRGDFRITYKCNRMGSDGELGGEHFLVYEADLNSVKEAKPII